MNKFLLLTTLVSLASAGVLDVGTLQGRGLNLQDGTNQISQMSQNDLQRQKFLLDVLQRVQDEPVNEQINRIGQSLVTDSRLYVGGIDDQMQLVINMAQQQRLLSKNEVFSIGNESHLNQLRGIYQILVSSGSWETLQQNIAFLRVNVNGELLVNALVLALKNREDTQSLIVPGIEELLPEVYFDDEVVRQAQNVDPKLLIANMKTQRPGLLDLIGLNKRKALNRLGLDNEQANILTKTHLWMPWREMRMELALKKLGGGQIGGGQNERIAVRGENKVVIPGTSQNIENDPLALLTEDIGVKTFVQNIINNLVLLEGDSQGNVNEEINNGNQRLGLGQMGRGGILGRGIQNQDLVEQILGRGGILGQGVQNRGILGRGIQNQQMDEQILGRIGSGIQNRDIDEQILGRGGILGRGNQNSGIEEQLLGRQGILGRGNQNRGMDSEGINGIRSSVGDDLPTSDATNDRLLHINRRRLNNMQGQKNQLLGNEKNRFMNMVRGGAVSDGRRILGRDEQLNDIRMTMGGRQNDENLARVGLKRTITGLDMNDELPTTTIDDERLLHVNRRRLNQRQNVNTENIHRRVSSIRDGRHVDKNMKNQGEHGRQTNQYNDEIQQGNNDLQNLLTNVLLGLIQQYRVDLSRGEQIELIDLIQQNQQQKQQRGQQQNQQKNQQQNQQLVELIELIQQIQQQNQPRGQQQNQQLEGLFELIQQIQQQNQQGGQQQNQNIYGNKRSQQQRGQIDLDEDILGSINRRRMNNAINQQEQDEQEILLNILGRRVPRSLSTGNDNRRGINKQQLVQVLLHNIQQLVARINLERISVGQQELNTINPQRINNPMLLGALDQRFALRLNDMRQNTRLNRIQLEQIGMIESRLEMIVRDQLNQISNSRGRIGQNQEIVEQVIGNVVTGRTGNVGILSILRQLVVLSEGSQGNGLEIQLSNPVVQHILGRIVRVVDQLRQQLLNAYDLEDLQLEGVTINDVRVDKLRTYIDEDESDLSNLVNLEQEQNTDQRIQPMVVTRQQRLNHKNFNIDLDITSDRTQQVLVRVLLGPKTDLMGRETSLEERRKNFILLDTIATTLQAGRNRISRNSRDATWTARDTTPVTEIYQQVMSALRGDVTMLQMSRGAVNGETGSFPQRLLLPRGQPEGLPMQLLAIVTPVLGQNVGSLQNNNQDNQIGSMGMSTLNLDRLPMGFPLDRQIKNEDQLLDLTNVQVRDVLLIHEN